jgi:signal recognition particle subunit SEC65
MATIESDYSDDDIDNMDFELPTDVLFTAVDQYQPAVQSARPQQPLQATQEPQIPLEIIKDWTCIYPVYIDVDKSTKRGRMIPTSVAVKEPAAIYIAEAVKQLKFNAVLEGNKRHPQDCFTYGRIKVQLKVDGRATHPYIKTKKQLLIEVSKMLPSVIEEVNKINPDAITIASESRSQITLINEDMAKITLADAKKNARKKIKKSKK